MDSILFDLVCRWMHSPCVFVDEGKLCWKPDPCAAKGFRLMEIRAGVEPCCQSAFETTRGDQASCPAPGAKSRTEFNQSESTFLSVAVMPGLPLALSYL